MRRKHLRVSVPWPSIVLSPNARVHWGKKRTEVQKARNYAYWETCSRAQGERAVPLRRIEYKCSFYPPTRRQRDEDNLIASLKPTLDGIADALRVNDSTFHLLEPHVGEPDRPHGHVDIDLYWTEEH